MDFGEILDEWEKIKREHGAPSSTPSAEPSSKKAAPKKPKPSALESWLAVNDVGDRATEGRDDEYEYSSPARRAAESRRLSALRAQAVLDLHGMTGLEAESAVASFIDASARGGMEKVLVIHGKGLHSAGAPVLKNAARRALEAHPLAGRFGEADKTEGGSGALWVMIRSRR